MALRPVSDGDNWSQIIADSAAEFMNAVITITLPGTPGAYDPVTDTYGAGVAGTVLIDDRAARAQHLSSPSETTGAGEWGVKRRYRWQILLDPSDPIIPKGAILTCSNGGRDASLTQFTYEVLSATGSSHAALRTIETLSEVTSD